MSDLIGSPLIESSRALRIGDFYQLVQLINELYDAPYRERMQRFYDLRTFARSCFAEKTTRNLLEFMKTNFAMFVRDVLRQYDVEIRKEIDQIPSLAVERTSTVRQSYANLNACLIESGKSAEECEEVWRVAVPLLKDAGFDVAPRTLTLQMYMPAQPAERDSRVIADRVQSTFPGSVVREVPPAVELGSRRRRLRMQRSRRSRRSRNRKPR